MPNEKVLLLRLKIGCLSVEHSAFKKRPTDKHPMPNEKVLLLRLKIGCLSVEHSAFKKRPTDKHPMPNEKVLLLRLCVECSSVGNFYFVISKNVFARAKLNIILLLAIQGKSLD